MGKAILLYFKEQFSFTSILFNRTLLLYIILVSFKGIEVNAQTVVLDNGAIETPVISIMRGTSTIGGVKHWQNATSLLNNPACLSGEVCTYRNVISFYVNQEASNIMLDDFTASVDLSIEYKLTSASSPTILTKTLSLVYKKGEGLLSDARQYIHFENMQYVNVTINSFTFPAPISGLDFKNIITLENTTYIAKTFANLSSSLLTWKAPIPTVLADGNDHLKVEWNFPANPGNNAVQLEWAWLENEIEPKYFMGGTFSNASKQKLLDQGATRIELGPTAKDYKIPMLYDGQGKLHYRVRGINIKPSGTRVFGPWSAINSVSFSGHNNKLNWQSTSSFAEEGKHKSVIAYFDGGLRQRQMVTKDNVTGNIITSETLYDHEGRPAIQILPAAGINNVIAYQANLNKFNRPESTLNPQNNGENHADFFDFKFAGSGTPALLTTPGSASAYYSTANPNTLGTDKNVPDAEGYPYSVTRYTPDGTGRVLTQSGVGAAHKMGSGRETKYFYGTPSQEELDALFGTEVGIKSHYFKNMVQDANGQMSVSYADMRGRTIATALAGESPTNLTALNNANNLYPNQFRETRLRINLLDSNSNIKKDNKIEAINTILVPYRTEYTFTYKLTPESLILPTCETPQQICYECLYDLEFVVTDESGERTSPVIYKKFSNLNVEIDSLCNTTTRLFQDSANLGPRYSTIVFTDTLEAGSYSIKKTLTLSESSLEVLKKNYEAKMLCTTEFTNIFDSVYSQLQAITNCDTPIANEQALSCASCTDSLGSFNDFKTKYLSSIGHQGAVLTPLQLEIETAYKSGLKNCQLLCGTLTMETATKRELMLADMMPYTGQYARKHELEGIGSKYNIFAESFYPSQPYYKNPKDSLGASGFYMNDYNLPDETIHTSPATLSQLTINSFNESFKSKWAEALLPYHPEYQRLLFAERNLNASYNWVNTFNNVTNYNAAQTAGYIFKANADIVLKDSFFALPATAPAQRDSMTKWLTTQYKDGLTLWQYAYYSAICPTNRTSSPCNNPTTIPKFPPYAITDAFKDSVWNRFKGLYLQGRTELMNNFVATQKPLSGTDEQQLVTASFILHFPRSASQQMQQLTTHSDSPPGELAFWPTPGTPGGTPNLLSDWNSPAAQANMYKSKCESYINQWKASLLQCPSLANHSNVTAIIDTITRRMVEVCRKGSDEANPSGSSTVAPSYPSDGTPRSFEQVINQVFLSYGISTTDICNPYVVEFPKPYGTGRPLAPSVVTTIDSCNCERFGNLKTEAIAAGKNPNILTQLNQYLKGAYGDTLTASLFEGLNRCNELTIPIYANCDSIYNTVIAPCHPLYNPCEAQAPIPPDLPQGRMLKMIGDSIVVETMSIPRQGFCPPGYRWNDWIMDCEYIGDENPWMCRDPWVYNPMTGQCELPGLQCAPGLVYSDIWAMCVGPNNCPPGYEWNYSLGDCTPILIPDCTYNCFVRTECDTVYLSSVALVTPSVMPEFMKCGFVQTKTCLTCTDVKDLVASFKTTFALPYNAPPYSGVSNLDSLQVAYYQNMARFINYRTGFSYSWASYMQAIDSAECNLNVGGLQTILCRNTKPLSDTTGMFAVEAPCQVTYDMAYHKAEKIYKVRYERLLQDFETAYRAKCMEAQKKEIFTVSYLPKEYHYTLYYYDQAGNLVKTVPPAGVTPNYDSVYLAGIQVKRKNRIAEPIAHKKVTQYRYNSLNQVVVQNSPDGSTSKFWYDKLGRLVVSQNREQLKTKRYSYTLYDTLGRITEVGQKVQNTNMTQLVSQNPTALTAWINGTGAREQLTQTVYDMVYAPATADPAVAAGITQKNLRNRVSYTLVKNLSTDVWQTTATFYTYDAHGNVNKLLQDYRGLNTSHNVSRFKNISYKYDLISGKVNEVAYQAGEADAFYHRYNYDGENRITEVLTSRDKVYWEKDATYEYYKHGPLARAVLGQQQVQGIDYAYTIQGWLKGVNSSNLDANKDMGGDSKTGSVVARDVFGFALHYFDNGSAERDYKPIGTTESFARPNNTGNFKSLYNGNIGAMTVNNGGLHKGEAATTNKLPLLYNYNYDQLNRIVSMQAFKGLDSVSNTWTPLAIDDYKERIGYDPDGNIRNYIRYGSPSIAGKQKLMDSLNYEYWAPEKNNFLRRVADNAAFTGYYTGDIDNQATTQNYKYDSIGNLISDAAEGITAITWTVYGKIATITKSGSTISYTYDAAGNRITKTTGGVTTLYVRDASGNVMSVYEIPSVNNIVQKELHLYGSSRLGIVMPESKPVDNSIPITGSSSAFVRSLVRGEKIFELSNHLGNVLVTISDKKLQIPKASPNQTQIDYYTADVVTASDYAPFGMQLFGRTYSASSRYRYGFNGKENDNDVKGEGNQQDYGFRIYDTRLGRFLSVDPLSESYPELTSYQFASNTPIENIDLDGLEKVSYLERNKSNNVVDALGNLPGNVVVSTYNGFAGIWNKMVDYGNAVFNSSDPVAGFSNQLGKDWDAIKSGVGGTFSSIYDYQTNTPLKQQAKDWLNIASDVDTWSQAAEGTALFYLGGKTNTILKTETSPATFVKINEKAKIGVTGKVGERYLKTLGGVSQKYFETASGKGGRFVDQFVNGVAHESKVGYTTLTKDIKMQIAKDVELLNSKTSGVNKIVWNFFESPTTGKAGASKPLLKALEDAGIETTIIRNP